MDERKKLTILHVVALALIALYGLFEVYQWRNIAHSIDSISYLDIADATFRGDWKNAINSFWSPFYSWILGAVLAVFRPDMEHELLAMRLTNFGLLLLYELCFFKFAQTFRLYLRERNVHWLSEFAYWTYMYCLLAFTGLALGGCDKDTPDMISASFVIIASTMFLRIALQPAITLNYALMGCALGFAYLAKAIVLPVSTAYYAATIWELRKNSSSWKKLIITAACQLILVAPWVMAISQGAGHFTITDAPRNFFLWSESQHARQVHYQMPELLHPTRKIFSNPDVFKFETPFDSTYPPWINAGYWTDGAVDPEPIARKIRYFRNNISFYTLEVFSFCILVFAVTSIFLRKPCTSPNRIISGLPIAAPGLLAMLLYSISSNMMGHMMERYLVAWFALLYSGILLMVNLPDNERGQKAGRVFLCTLNSTLLLALAVVTYMHVRMPEIFPYPHDLVVAKKLREVGLQPGDRIALIPLNRRYFWARLAHLKVVADITDEQQFYNLPPEKREELLDKLRALNVKAIVRTWFLGDISQINEPKYYPGEPWIKIPPTQALVYLIPPKDPNPNRRP